MITFRRLGGLGRFGNRLFQYAGTRLYGELNGFSAAFPHWEGEDVFGIPHTGISLRDRMLPTVQLSDMPISRHPGQLLAPLRLWRHDSMARLWQRPSDNINLYGYLQDDTTLAMLRGHADIIRSWYQFITPIDSAMRDIVSSRGSWDAIHIRRGDRITYGGATDIPSVIRLASNLIGDRPLYIASDDPGVTAAFEKFRPFQLSSLPATIPRWLADFWMLRNAALVIAGGSTFAWWAAFLGNMEYWAQPLHIQWGDQEPAITKRHP